MLQISSLIFDIKLYIAGFNADAWYLMYRYDPEFKHYAQSTDGIRLYTDLFTKIERYPNYLDITVEKYLLFNKLHRQPDISGESSPAVIKSDGTLKYFINGEMHRNGDNPAYVFDVADDVSCDDEKLIAAYHKNGKIHRNDDINGTEQPALIYYDGAIEYYNNDKLHRKGDQPAIMCSDGTLEYFKNGRRHRDVDEFGCEQPAYICGTHVKYFNNGVLHRNEDQPAVIYFNDVEIYYKHGETHRNDDKPAICFADGGVKYYKNNKLHRDGDLPVDISADGTLKYYKNDNLHRDNDQPAVICYKNRCIKYYIDGAKHRDNNLPAVIKSNGEVSYYNHDNRFSPNNGSCNYASVKTIDILLNMCEQKEYIMNIWKA